MNLSNIQDLFNYLGSLEKGRVRILKESCTIWLPNGILLDGRPVKQIDETSRCFNGDKNFFVYTNEQIAFKESSSLEISGTPMSFLYDIFNRYPDIAPIEYRLNEHWYDFKEALNEMSTIRIQLGKLKSEYNELQEKHFELKRHNEYVDKKVFELTEKCGSKSSYLATVLIPLINSECTINIIQMKAIHSFVIEHSPTRKITIKTGFRENTVCLTYEIHKWGSADLEGVIVGCENKFTFFNQNGQETDGLPQELGLSVSMQWEELTILLNHFEHKEQIN